MDIVGGIHQLLAAPSPVPSPMRSTVAVLVPSAPAVSPNPATDPFLERFLTSSGFGGLAALGAALIAAWIATKQLKNARRQQRHDRWWETLGWVYDRAVVDAGKREALPHRVTFTMLTELAHQAQSPPTDQLQVGTIEAIASMFAKATDDSPGRDEGEPDVAVRPESTTPPQGSGSDGPTPGTSRSSTSLIEVRDPLAVDLMEALRVAVQGSTAASSAVLADAYEQSVRRAVTRLLPEPKEPLVSAGKQNDPIDFKVKIGGRTVFFDVVYRSQSLPSHQVLARVRRGTRFLDESAPDAKFILVSNTLASERLSHEANGLDRRLSFVTWRGEEDDHRLLSALLP